MIDVQITNEDLKSLEFIRVALSEETTEQRTRAIYNSLQISKSERIAAIESVQTPGWLSDPDNGELVQWIAGTSTERHEASIEFFTDTYRHYVSERERKLNIAEEIGKRVINSIADGKFEGLHTDSGILSHVRDFAKKHNVRMARDSDTLRKIWSTYRGIVHLGMAMDYCDDNPGPEENILLAAERIRRSLSENGPGRRKKPYVDPAIQFSFSIKPFE